MLDIACGSGHLLGCVSKQTGWHLEGLDADPEMLRIAHERVPEGRFHRADMAGWHIDRQFDIITCLGSSLAAVCTAARLASAFASMERHLAPGGIEHITERHELGLFDMDAYAAAFGACGLREVADAAAPLAGVYTNRGTHLLERTGCQANPRP